MGYLANVKQTGISCQGNANPTYSVITFTFTRIPSINKTDNNKYQQGNGEIRTFCTTDEIVREYRHFGEKPAVPQKKNIDLPYDSASPLLCMDLREMKTYVHIITCTHVLVKKWKQHMCPSTGEQMNKIRYMHTI